MTKEALKKLEDRVFATNLRTSQSSATKKFDRQGFVRVSHEIQEIIDEQEKNADSGSK